MSSSGQISKLCRVVHKAIPIRYAMEFRAIKDAVEKGFVSRARNELVVVGEAKKAKNIVHFAIPSEELRTGRNS